MSYKGLPPKIEDYGLDAYVRLSNNAEFYISSIDLDLVVNHAWYGKPDGTGYIIACKTRANEVLPSRSLSRVIGLRCGYPEDQDVEHEDRDKRNNRRGNLRPASRSQNQANRTTALPRSRTGLKGVGIQGNRFDSEIKVDGVRVALGIFDTPEAAHEAYKEASLRYFGAFSPYPES